ncbi:hypothetical protein MRX96_014559 [Rhipicephalus microplus]
MRADAALALRGQLIDARREIVGLQRLVLEVQLPLVGDILGGLAAATTVCPAAVSAGPGVQVVTGPAAMSPPGSRVAGCMSYLAALGSGATSEIQGPSRNGPSGPQGGCYTGRGLPAGPRVLSHAGWEHGRPGERRDENSQG